jgi:hypothetical protein
VTAYYGWAFTNQHIFYVLDSAGDETGRILQVNIAGEPLTSGAGQFAGRHWRLLEWTLDFDVPGESELLTNLRTTTMVGLAGLGIAIDSAALEYLQLHSMEVMNIALSSDTPRVTIVTRQAPELSEGSRPPTVDSAVQIPDGLTHSSTRNILLPPFM